MSSITAGNEAVQGAGQLRSAAPTPQVTFAMQNSLKKLPIPPLEQTLDKFLNQTVKPILTEKEWQDTKAAVESFKAGKAREIYDALKQYEQSKNSYIEEFWDAAYLEYDASVAINVNPVFVLEDDPTPARSKLVPRAVSLIFSSLKFVRAVRKEILTVDKVKDAPLCMDQYRRLFATARVPDPSGADKDVTVTSPNSTHIVVICRGQFYYFQALTSETFELALTERELTKSLEMIVQDAKSHEAKSPVGVLTAENRSRWRKIRKELCEVSLNNQRVLEVIDSALFVVSLDVDYEPDSVANAAANILHGTTETFNGVGDDGLDGYGAEDDDEKNKKRKKTLNGETMTSRWYDKLMLVIATGGTAGVNFEHSAFDGHTVLRFASDVFTDTIIRFAQTISGGIACHLDVASLPRMMVRPDVKPRKLEFDLTPTLERCIKYAKSRLADAIHQNHTTTLEFNGFGKNFLVQNGLSPDATVQLGIQTAFMELYGEPANTYESVLTKAFFHGRTEAGRSCTGQAVEFMRAYCGLDHVLTEEKIRLLRAAAQAHTKMTGECAKGMGVDRLLYALECLWTVQHPHEVKPDIFRSPGWMKLNQSVLSTSNCGNPSLRFFGFGPVCPQGFGIGYIIKDDAMHFMITSKRRQTDQFRKTLARFFETIHDDLIAIAPSEAAPVISLMMFRSKSASSLEDGAKKEDVDMIDEEEDNGYDFFGLNAKVASDGRVGRELNLL